MLAAPTLTATLINCVLYMGAATATTNLYKAVFLLLCKATDQK